MGGAYGVQVLNNEFAHLLESEHCDRRIHIGGIQVYGGYAHPPEGQLLPRQRHSAGGLSMPGDAYHYSLVEDNVWVCTCIYPGRSRRPRRNNSTFVHNAFAGGGGIHFYTEQG